MEQRRTTAGTSHVRPALRPLVRKPAGHDTTRPRKKHDIRNVARAAPPSRGNSGSRRPEPVRSRWALPCPACRCELSTLLSINQAALSKTHDMRRCPACTGRTSSGRADVVPSHFRILTGNAGPGNAMLALARHGSAFPFSALAVTLQQLSVQSRRKPGQTPARGLRPFLHGQSVVTLSPERAPGSKAWTRLV